MNESVPSQICLVKQDQPLQKEAPPTKPKNPRYQARFVKESIFDKHEVAPCAEFSKTWVFRNDGETAWPIDVQFLQSTGYDIGAKPVQIGYEVQAETNCEVTVMCKAPEQEGRYTAYFRMQTGNIKFGHKVWCDILVVKPKQAAAVNMIAHAQENQEMKEEPSFQPGDKSGDGLMQSQITIASEMKSPKMLYYEDLAKESDEQLREALTSLYEFGFCDFKVNKALMLKYKNVNTVAETLCNGVLNESALKDIYVAKEE